jgi:GNAT superfamily N-acetyltransferase
MNQSDPPNPDGGGVYTLQVPEVGLPLYEPDSRSLGAAFDGFRDRQAWLGYPRIVMDERMSCEFEDYLQDITSARVIEDQVYRIPGHKGVLLATNENSDSLLLQFAPDSNKALLVGYYTGPTVVIQPAYRGEGLGAWLVLHKAVSCGESPQAAYDKVGYTSAGLLVHQRAWDLGRSLMSPVLTPERDQDFSPGPGM